ncbi:Crp/Fnr family transcriptional regulator [Beggiatoa leptomitoformis]|uniref:Helix-turn-helix domain-containing protein n=1 Tax=Beggiatoa leptomitoformis TaxID=288004 RepID=A0A2N9YIJ3_9GAMM|nr:Crp/Fnr family transcriptional regulator [Beggiatoa leptomitoformis]ALG67432.1 helix-turn-helix domain-containing protein [Beggiatoa leptomitoformis]AUI70352.1 helix-turn-helix domain-containing protein [Beggiatoa leptomitoformis]
MTNRSKRSEQTVPCHACPVRKLTRFQPLPESQQAVVQQYRAGQTLLPAKHHLYREGELHGNIYTLFSGWVMLYKTLSNGGRQILRYALPGDFISFQADLQAPMNHSAQTLTECTLCVFPRQNLIQMLQTHPELGLQIAWITARDMTLGQEYLVNIGRKNAKERLAFLFTELFQRMGMHDPKIGNSIPFPMTQEDIADTLGLTLVHVNRTLRNLREEGLINLSHHTLTILDYAQLAELAGFNNDTLATDQPLL